MFALIVLGIVALGLSLATAVLTLRDGYRASPTDYTLLDKSALPSSRRLVSVR